jgi:flavin-dependent dehydrogenase
MQSVEAIIVGGGPAGSAAAQRLVAGGVDTLILDRQPFPRHKLCAGWITPEVVRDVGLDVSSYPHGFLSFRRLHWHLRGLRLPLPCVQHSIRRVEFDHWLLQRSGATVLEHTVKTIRRDGEHYVLDESFRCRYLIGAGGTACPVRRSLFDGDSPRPRGLQTVTLEIEFPFEWRDPDCHLWFFEHGLPGYSWYVPKAAGWLNVGIGAMATRLKQRGETIRQHWRYLQQKMERQFAVRLPDDPPGYSYFLRGADVRRGPGSASHRDNALLIGDSAGLATRDLCEGIGPAIQSGRAAAESILARSPYALDAVNVSSLGGGLVSRWMDWAFTRGASPVC